MNRSKRFSSTDGSSQLVRELKQLRIDAIKPIEPKKLHKFHSKANAPVEPRTGRLFDYEQMVMEMLKNAKKHKRDLIDDILRIIFIFHVQGNNIDKIMELPMIFATDELKENLTTLQKIYGLTPQAHEGTPTLSRVAEAFPHVSLVVADMVHSAPGLLLRSCVTPKDLGVKVHFHFRMNYFSSLIDTSSEIAQIALFVHTLCLAKGILKTGGMKEIGPAFGLSCKMSARMMGLRLAPEDARQKFTEYITENFNFSADSLCLLWDHVIGETKITFQGGVLLTPFHEQVLNQQPLNLSKWRHLFGQYD